MNIKDNGLLRDKGDEKGQRVCKEDLIGFTYKNEYYQPMPYFFTREGNVLPITGHYKGGVAFLVASGPSFAQLDSSKLDNCFTLGLNNSPKTYRPNAWVSVDDPCRFLYSIWMDPRITKYVPYSHAEKQIWNSYEDKPAVWTNGKPMYVGDCPNVIYWRRNSKFEASRWMTESTLNWGNHEKFGGCRTVMLPALRILFLLGFRTVYLLGVDFDMSSEKRYHFEENRDNSAIKCNNKTYKAMNGNYFKNLKPYFDQYGFNVFNCNKESKLEVFDYVPYDDAITRAMAMTGDHTKEQTLGMYRSPDEKYGKKKKENKVKKSSSSGKELAVNDNQDEEDDNKF